MTYCNGLHLTVGAGGVILSSPNGVTWTSQTSPTGEHLNSVTYGDSQYIAVGNNGTVVTSPDAINWAIKSSGAVTALNSVIWIDTSLYTATKPVPKSVTPNTNLKVQARNSLLTISLPSSMLGKAVDLAVYTASGREVVKKRIQRGVDRFIVSVPNLARGSYVLAVKEGTQKQAVRFVVMR